MPYKRKTVDVVISEDLKTILNEIKSESVVAELLLRGRIRKELLVEQPINFISLSKEDKTKLSYLTEDRIKDIDESVIWTTSRRFRIKPGAFVSKLFKEIEPKDVEKFSNLYRAQVNKKNFTFKVVSGDDIRKYYHHENYASDCGSLGNSCMKHDRCQDFLSIYTENPDTTKMVVMLDEGGLALGRALLWEFDSVKIMDRIYSVNDDEFVFFFKKWATDNGYLYKSSQSWNNTLKFEQIGRDSEIMEFNIKLNKHSFTKYPYLDTFKFMDDSGVLYNYVPKEASIKTLCGCDGDVYTDEIFKIDGIDHLVRHRGECCFLDYLNLYTYSGNTNYSTVNNQYILSKDSEYNEDLDDYIFIGEYENLNNYKKIERKRRDQSTHSISAELSYIDYNPIFNYSMANIDPIHSEDVNTLNEVQIETGITGVQEPHSTVRPYQSINNIDW